VRRYEHRTTFQLLRGGEPGTDDGTGHWRTFTVDPKPPDDSGAWRIVSVHHQSFEEGPSGVIVWEREVLTDEDEGESPLVGAVKALEATLDAVSGHLDDIAVDVKHGAEALQGIYRDMPTRSSS
jgi:hypothetical protein